jgi:hypothetical protein
MKREERNCVIIVVTENGIVASKILLPKGGKVTRLSILEYAEAVRGCYFLAPKKAKTEMLNEFVATTNMHRKGVIRLLNRRSGPSGSKTRGRPRLYRHEAMVALKMAWEASDCLCSKRLQPFLPELVGILKRCGELTMTGETEAQPSVLAPVQSRSTA